MPRIRSLVALVLPLAMVGDAGALPPGSARAQEAFALCQVAEEQTGDARVGTLTQGLELAQAAVDADPRDALAQFALFCNGARRVQAAGVGIATSLALFRAMHALDAAVDLAPDDADVMAAEGALLVELPRFLGGDEARGERYLRRALELDPSQGAARGYLANVLGRRGVGD
jgi:hypothetical protein